jgi:hypothetical protein
MKNKKEFIGGQKLTMPMILNRINHLENIICDLKEVLEKYARFGCLGTFSAGRVLKKHNKSFLDLYEEIDKEEET